MTFFTERGVKQPQILCEDGPLMAVNKPAGLLTQGVPHGEESLESWVKSYLKEKYQKPGNVYLGVPHRLDRPVSGIVIFARNSKVAARLAEQFRERIVQKTYLAVTERTPESPEGTLEDWLLKDADAAHVTVANPEFPGAKRALLDYRVIATSGERALLEVQLHTGRMHQIRVQLASRGWPIYGDCQYGAADLTGTSDTISWPANAIGLHAWRLKLKHPIRYDDVLLEASIPEEWNQFNFDLKGISGI